MDRPDAGIGEGVDLTAPIPTGGLARRSEGRRGAAGRASQSAMTSSEPRLGMPFSAISSVVASSMALRGKTSVSL